MKVSFGLKAHSGWAVLVVVGNRDGHPIVAGRNRIELVEEDWARQPYHAAQDLKGDEARDTVERGTASARRLAARELNKALERERERGNDVTACAVLAAEPMPDWRLEEILGVHFRLHKAEGVLFRDALARAVKAAGIKLVSIPEKRLVEHAERSLGVSATDLARQIADIGKAVGAPWGRDQKDSAIAALVALHQ